MNYGLIRTAHPRIIIQSNGASPPASGTEVHWHVNVPDDLLFLGESAGNIGTSSGLRAVGIGRNALAAHTLADDVVGIGSGVFALLTSGSRNTAGGSGAGAAVTASPDNVLFGFNAGNAYNDATTGLVAIGSRAGESMPEGSSNTFVGLHAGRFLAGTSAGENQSGANTAVGESALRGLAATVTSITNNTAIGANVMQFVEGTADGNTAVGSQAGNAITFGDLNSLFGVNSGVLLTTGFANTLLGESVGTGITTGARNVLIGAEIQAQAAGTNDLIAIGVGRPGNAGQLVVVDPALGGVFIGDSTPGNWPTVSGLEVVAIGSNAAGSLTTGNQFVAIGTNAAANVTADFDGVFVGYNAGGVGIGTGAQYNTAVGFNALRGVAATPLGQANTCIGAGAGENIAASSANTLVGAFAGEDIGSGSNNTVVGYNSAGGAVNLTTGSRNVVIGTFTDTPTIASTDVIIIGDMSGGNLGSIVYVDPGNDSVFIGSNTPGNYGTASGGDNVVIGDSAAANMTTSVGVTVVGAGAAGTGVLSGDNNTFVGFQAGAGIGGFGLGQNCTVVGANAGALLSGGNSNTFLGQSAGGSVGSGFSNVMIGDGAGDQATANNGNRNIIIGSTSTASGAHSDVIVLKMDSGFGSNNQQIVVDPNVDGVFIGGANAGNWPTVSGLDNTSIGDGSGVALTTGDENTFLGSGAGATAAGGAGNICIGFGADVPAAGTNNFLNIGSAFFGDLANARFRLGGAGAITGTQQGIVFNNGTAETVRTITHGAAPDAQASAGGTLAPDFSQNQILSVTLTENITTVSAPTAPPGIGVFKLYLIQAAAGGPYTVGGWNGVFRWPGGTAPTMSAGASAVDIITFVYDGTNWDGTFNQDFQ